jgi:hypothetical protein
MDPLHDVELKADPAVKMAVESQESGGEDDAVMQPEPKSMRADQDALQALQGNKPARPRESTMADPAKVKRDEYIMDTNNSSIVSKRSVEKLYYSNEPEYFRYFVSKFKRRSPLINRGYWLRMKAVEHTVTRFLAERTAKRKVVINLGCG